MFRSVIWFGLTAVIFNQALSACLESSDCAARCDCRRTIPGVKYCYDFDIFKEEVETFNCGSKCGGFVSSGCTLEPATNISGCAIPCRECIGDAIAEMEGKCAPPRTPSPTPSPTQCVENSNCATGCTCIKTDSGDRFCGNDPIFREEITRFDCVNKCGGLDRPGCRYLPVADFSNCTSFCAECIRQSLGEAKDRCAKPRTRAEFANPSANPTPTLIAAPAQRKTPVGPCISTLWLVRQGLSQQVLHNGGDAPVICIPGFPCGTHGHLLRVCNTKRTACRLVSYADLCKQRDDCSTSVMPVSQLSHSYDWSVFRTSWASSGDTIELTSLSQKHDAREFSSSNVVARITDLLNRNGYGHICNAIARVPYSIRKVRYQFQGTEAS